MWVELTDAVLYYGFSWGDDGHELELNTDDQKFISYIDWTYRHRMWVGIGRLSPLTFYRPTKVNLECVVN